MSHGTHICMSHGTYMEVSWLKYERHKIMRLIGTQTNAP